MNELRVPPFNKNDNLHSYLESILYLSIKNRSSQLLKKTYLPIFKQNQNDSIRTKYELLKLSNDTSDYFDLIILDAFLESAYKHQLLDECLVDNKRIPKGSDYNYGRYFENKIISLISKYVEVESTQYKRCDAIILHPVSKDQIILEIKCSYWNTQKQIETYQKATGIKEFITVNGHGNSIEINELDIYRSSFGFFEKEFKKMLNGQRQIS